jgi:tryptophan synthase alpha chain
MGYLNPVEVMGYALFAERAEKAGIDAMLTVDLPPEESADLKAALSDKGIDSIFLIAPTTTEARIEKICDSASGYIYYVSLKGVTGASHLDVAEVYEKLALIRQYTSLPLSVGFGIKDAESAKAIGATADGVVVGSALVNAYLESSQKPDWNPAHPPALIQSIRAALDE